MAKKPTDAAKKTIVVKQIGLGRPPSGRADRDAEGPRPEQDEPHP